MNVKTMLVGPIQACCYIVSFNQSQKAMVIDPGGDGEMIVQFLKKSGLEPVYLVNTHGHIDHIGGNVEVKTAFPEIEIYIHPADAEMLTDASRNLSPELGYQFSSPPHNKLIEEGDILNLDGHKFKVLHLPGHTLGGVCLLYEPSDKKGPAVIFTGDTLFAMGIGRSDFPGGSHNQLINGIKQKIFSLPDNTIVYPGHGPATTVGQEKQTNPFF